VELFEIKTEVPAHAADNIDNTLLELGYDGWSLLEDAIQKRAWVVGIFPSVEEAESRWAELRLLMPEFGPAEIEVRALGDREWKDSYKAHFHAWQFGRRAFGCLSGRDPRLVSPPGDAGLMARSRIGIWHGQSRDDPAVRRTFGRICEGAGHERAGRGCWLWLGHFGAFRCAPWFCRCGRFRQRRRGGAGSEENAVLNGLGGRVGFSTGDLVGGLAGRQGEVVLANIQADVLQKFASQLLAAVAPGGTLILSGILAVERDVVQATFGAAAAGWRIESRVMGEWSDVVLNRP